MLRIHASGSPNVAGYRLDTITGHIGSTHPFTKETVDPFIFISLSAYYGTEATEANSVGYIQRTRDYKEKFQRRKFPHRRIEYVSRDIRSRSSLADGRYRDRAGRIRLLMVLLPPSMKRIRFYYMQCSTLIPSRVYTSC